MTIEATVNDLVASVDALTNSVVTKRAVLDVSANNADASAVAAVNSANVAAASATAAAASATTATNNATQIAAYKTAAAALDTTTTATAAVTNLLPDLLAKKDPARHPFRKKMPTLVLDFERQKCHRYSPSTGFGETPLNTFMTFARNSTATYTGPDGLIKTAAANEARYDYDPLTGECKGLLVEEQRTNLLTYSDTFSASPWTCQGAAVIPNAFVSADGKLTMSKLVELTTSTAHFVRQTLGSAIGACTFSLYAKACERYQIGVSVRYNSDVRYDVVYINLLTGSSYSKQEASGTLSYTVTPVGGGIYRISVTPKYVSTSTQVSVSLCSTDVAGPNYGGSGYTAENNQAGVYIWGAQLEAGSFPTSYIPTPATFTGRASTATYLDANGVVQTAASGVARSAAYDYDSDGVLRPIGLLLEASATNQLLYSEQFDNAAWTKNAGGTATAPVVTANYGVAPDGQTTADRVVMALNAGTTLTDMSDISQGTTTVADTTYTQSVWLKTTDGSTKVLQLSFNGENPKLITVTGTWQRFSNTGVASDAIRGFRLALRGTTGTSDSADVLVWGAQQGVGSYPSSYIPTTTAQVTRAADTSTSAQATRVADDAKVDGANFSGFYNQSQGTLVATQRIGTDTGVNDSNAYRRGVACLDIGTNAQIVRLCAAGKDVVVKSVDAQFDETIGTITANSTTRQAVRLSKANFIGAHDGALGAAHNVGSTPSVSVLRVGKSDPTNGYLNGHVARISYYPQPFTNEELQAATSA